jgi:citrate lyase beta subunit
VTPPPARHVLVSALDLHRPHALSDAGEVIVDLHDLPPAAKSDFLRLDVVAFLAAIDHAQTAIQINAPGTRWFDEDIIQIVMALGYALGGLVVPRVRHTEDLRAAAELLDEIEHEFPVVRPLALQARVGDARVAESIAEAPRLTALIVDSDDEGTQARALAVARERGLAAVGGPGVRPAFLPGAWTPG